MPRWARETLGDQRAPNLAVLAPSQQHQEGAIAWAFEDYSRAQAETEGGPDVLVSLSPLPLVRGPEEWRDCTVEEPCDDSDGQCESDAECVPPLICAPGIGKNFGWWLDVGVCVPPHCANGVMDAGEEGIDCGEPDCGTCLCGDGEISELFEEECDDGGESETCDLDCTFASCGDGMLNETAGEECDLGTAGNNGVQCNPDCTLPGACQDGSQCLSVYAQTQSSAQNQISVRLRVVNHSDTSASLNGLKISYWLIGDTSSPLLTACDYAAIGCNKVAFATSLVNPHLDGSDRRVDITLSSTTVLSPNQDSGDIQFRIYKQNSSNFVQTNDYSYPGTTYRAVPHITMYRASDLIWGLPPVNDFVCGNGELEFGEICEQALDSHCKSDCSGYNITNKTACTTAASCLSLKHKYGGSLTDQHLEPYLWVTNHTGVDIPVNQIRIRYWFTADSANPTFGSNCSQAIILADDLISRCELNQRVFQSLSPTFPTATHYLELRFTGSYVLEPGDGIGPLQTDVWKTDWSNFNESNDWSQSLSTTWAISTKSTVYVNGALYWGQEP